MANLCASVNLFLRRIYLVASYKLRLYPKEGELIKWGGLCEDMVLPVWLYLRVVASGALLTRKQCHLMPICAH